MIAKLTMKSGTRVELGVGKVIAGKEEWMFGEYFPAVGPVMAEHGMRQLASFAVVATNTAGVAPVQGSLTSWPSADDRARLHEDPRFVKYHQLRDDALEGFSDGHLFVPIDAEIELYTEHDYALVIAGADPLGSEPVVDLPLAADSTMQTYSGKSVRLHSWSDEAERVLAGPADVATIFRVRFNPPRG